MDISTTKDDDIVTMKLIGRLDTTTSTTLDIELQNVFEGIATLILDISDLEYLSSSGLRSILVAQKVMNKQGTMIIRGVNEIIMEIFEVTGFIDILTIE